MDNQPTSEIVKQPENKDVKPVGFAAHPENINRKGRPKKGNTLTDIMREVMEEELPSGKMRKEAFVRKVLELAYDGNEQMIKLVWNYLEGMPLQKNELSGPNGKELFESGDPMTVRTLLKVAQDALLHAPVGVEAEDGK